MPSEHKIASEQFSEEWDPRLDAGIWNPTTYRMYSIYAIINAEMNKPMWMHVVHFINRPISDFW